MNVHDKLFNAMVSMCEDYLREHNYERPLWMEPDRFNEIVDLTNTDFTSTVSIDLSCACKS